MRMDEFWDCTPFEFYEYADAKMKNAKAEDHRETLRRLEQTCLLLQPHLKKGRHIKPEDFLKKEDKSPGYGKRIFESVEEKRIEFEKLIEELS